MDSTVFTASEAMWTIEKVCESNRFVNRYPHVCVHLQCIMHSDGSGDTSHTTSNLINPIHCQCYRGTAACAHDEVEGYIQPSIDPHQLRHHPMVRVYSNISIHLIYLSHLSIYVYLHALSCMSYLISRSPKDISLMKSIKCWLIFNQAFINQMQLKLTSAYFAISILIVKFIIH
jgi:hypothetical protein